jgi:hypothetical protein
MRMRREEAAQKSRKVRPRFVAFGVALFVVVVAGILAAGWAVLELTVPEPDLGALLDEPIWTEVPPGGTVAFSPHDPEECGSGGSAIAFMRVEVPSGGDAAVAFYEDLAVRTGWTLTDEEPYRGATKLVDDREFYLGFSAWDTEASGGIIEIRGHSKPNGC